MVPNAPIATWRPTQLTAEMITCSPSFTMGDRFVRDVPGFRQDPRGAARLSHLTKFAGQLWQEMLGGRLRDALEAVRYFPRWLASQRLGHNALVDGQPWMVFRAIDYLARYSRPWMSVFEFGIGGSSIYWSERVRNVVGVEHDERWTALVRQHLAQQGRENVQLHHVRPEPLAAGRSRDPSDPADCVSGHRDWTGLDFRRYVSVIDSYPDASFDIVVVDGRARPSCFKRALPKLRPGGLVVWDDTLRDHYRRAVSSAPDYLVPWVATGPKPYSRRFGETTIWQLRQ